MSSNVACFSPYLKISHSLMLLVPIARFISLQVAAPNSEGGKKLVSSIGGITINDESLNDSGDKQNSGFLIGKSQDNLTSTRQATLGSLSFKVTDRSTSKKAGNVAPEDAGSNVKNPQELNVGGKKPAARAKVPFEKGYSQMDWLKLTRNHPDLAGNSYIFTGV